MGLSENLNHHALLIDNIRQFRDKIIGPPERYGPIEVGNERDRGVLQAYQAAIRQPCSRIPMTLERFARSADPDTLSILNNYWRNKENPLSDRTLAYLVSQQNLALADSPYPGVYGADGKYTLYHTTRRRTFEEKISPEKTFRAMFGLIEPSIPCNWGIALYCTTTPFADQTIEDVLRVRARAFSADEILTLRLTFDEDIEREEVVARQRYGLAETVLTDMAGELLSRTDKGRRVLHFLTGELQEKCRSGRSIRIRKWDENFAHRDDYSDGNEYDFNFNNARNNFIDFVALWDVLGLTFGRSNFQLYEKDLLSPLFGSDQAQLGPTAAHRMINIPREFYYGGQLIDPAVKLDKLRKLEVYQNSKAGEKYIAEFPDRRDLLSSFYFNYGEGDEEMLRYFLYPSFFRLGVALDMMHKQMDEQFTTEALHLIYSAYHYVLVTEAALILNDPAYPKIADSWEPNPYERFRLLISPTTGINVNSPDGLGGWINTGDGKKYDFNFSRLPSKKEVIENLDSCGVGDEYRAAQWQVSQKLDVYTQGDVDL